MRKKVSSELLGAVFVRTTAFSLSLDRVKAAWRKNNCFEKGTHGPLLTNIDYLPCVPAAEDNEREDFDLPELRPPENQIPSDLEVALIPYHVGGTYPGLFIFTQAARMMRPVRHLETGAIEMLGTLEQNNMHIQCPDSGEGGSPGLQFTHRELNAGALPLYNGQRALSMLLMREETSLE